MSPPLPAEPLMLPECGDAAGVAEPLLVQGLCLPQVGSAQRWPRQGSSETPHQLQHQPGERQLEIPAEGQRRQRFLLACRCVAAALAAPSPMGKVSWVAQPQPSAAISHARLVPR